MAAALLFFCGRLAGRGKDGKGEDRSEGEKCFHGKQTVAASFSGSSVNDDSFRPDFAQILSQHPVFVARFLPIQSCN